MAGGILTLTILSDTHGGLKNFPGVINVMRESDAVIFLGDGQSDTAFIEKEFAGKLYAVRGNCDLAAGEIEKIFNLGGITFLITHGHTCGVKRGLLNLQMRALEAGAEVACFGHTHRAEQTKCEGVLFLNPGSLSPRGVPSYIYAVITGGKIFPRIVEI